MYRHSAAEKPDFQLEAAADMGTLMIDGLTDGLWLMNDGDIATADIADTAFAILPGRHASEHRRRGTYHAQAADARSTTCAPP